MKDSTVRTTLTLPSVAVNAITNIGQPQSLFCRDGMEMVVVLMVG